VNRIVRRTMAFHPASLAGLILGSALVGCHTAPEALVNDACAQDRTVVCVAGSFGFSCTGNATPGMMNTRLTTCESGPEVSGKATYCCDAPRSFSCAANPSIAGCPNVATGYSCFQGATPAEFDTTLTCTAGTDGENGSTDFCCATGTSCAQDASVTGCKADATGYSCALSDTPADSNHSLACNQGTPGTNLTDYCCLKLGSGTCEQVFSVVGCMSPSLGFSCTGNDTPTKANPSLVCGQGTTLSGTTVYCCTD
jgi:hypothetical protein